MSQEAVLAAFERARPFDVTNLSRAATLA